MGNSAVEALEYVENLYRCYQDAKSRKLIEKIMKAESVDEALEIYRQTHGYKIGFDIFSLADKAKLRERSEELRNDLNIMGADRPIASIAVSDYLYDYTENPD